MQEQGEQMLLTDIAKHRYCKWCNEPMPEWYHKNRDYHMGECERRAGVARREKKKEEDRRTAEEERKEAFLEFDYERPEVRRYLYEEAKAKVQGGANRLSMRGLFYVVREKYKISIPNNHSRFYADDFNKMPEFVNMFKQTGKGDQ